MMKNYYDYTISKKYSRKIFAETVELILQNIKDIEETSYDVDDPDYKDQFQCIKTSRGEIRIGNSWMDNVVWVMTEVDLESILTEWEDKTFYESEERILTPEEGRRMLQEAEDAAERYREYMEQRKGEDNMHIEDPKKCYMTKETQLLDICKTGNYDADTLLKIVKEVKLNEIIVAENATYLSTAIDHNNFEIAEILLKNGADPNIYDEWDGPILWNLQYGGDFYGLSEDEQLKFVKLVLDYGANPLTEWDSNETLMEYVLWKVFNEMDDDNWDYIIKFFVYLIAYGGKLPNGMPEIYQTIDKNHLDEYEFFFAENGGRGEIMRNGEVVAFI